MMELKDLIGEHILSGVEIGISPFQIFGDYFEDCQFISFILDGITYTAIEDPDDDCHSCMREILVSDTIVSNLFPGQRVLGRMQEDDYSEILDLIDLQTGGVVLSVGTFGEGDYYPYWVAEFTPENMAINAKLQRVQEPPCT